MKHQHLMVFHVPIFGIHIKKMYEKRRREAVKKNVPPLVVRPPMVKARPLMKNNFFDALPTKKKYYYSARGGKALVVGPLVDKLVFCRFPIDNIGRTRTDR